MNNVSFGVPPGKVEKVNGASCVGNINHDVTDLFQSVGAFVHAQQL